MVLQWTDLIGQTENVGIILLEPSHSRQTTKCSREFISVQNAKVCHSPRQLFPWTWTVVKDQTENKTYLWLKKNKTSNWKHHSN